MSSTIAYLPALQTNPNSLMKSDPLVVKTPVAASTRSVGEGTLGGLDVSLTDSSLFDGELTTALSSLCQGKFDVAISQYASKLKKETHVEKKIYKLEQLAECYRSAVLIPSEY